MARADFADTPRRLLAGERQSWDDASINFLTCVPWPWGGDRCADRWGVRVGRFQLLLAVDDASDFCPGYTYVIREQQSYRAEDVAAAQFRMWRDQYAPERVMLEGGAWQALRARDFYRAAGVGVEDATGRPNSKLVEGFFNRLWTTLSVLPGQLGRWRGEMQNESATYLRCRDGRADPRAFFPALPQALADLDKAIAYLNAESVESKKYGRWAPQAMHRDGLERWPRPRLSPEMAMYAAPVRETRMVRRNMVAVTCEGPFGRFPYHFSDERLWEYEGCQVTVWFDPWDSPIRALIALAQEWRGLKPGAVICPAALCLDDAPEVLATLDGLRVETSADAVARAVEMRRRISQAIRREHRALGFGGARVASATDARGPGGMARVEITNAAPAADPRPAVSTARVTLPLSPPRRAALSDDDVDRMTAEADALEARMRARGELLGV